MPGRRLLATAVAARLANCHPVTIRRAVAEGELPALRLGPTGHLRIDRADLENWLRPGATRERA